MDERRGDLVHRGVGGRSILGKREHRAREERRVHGRAPLDRIGDVAKGDDAILWAQ